MVWGIAPCAARRKVEVHRDASEATRVAPAPPRDGLQPWGRRDAACVRARVLNAVQRAPAAFLRCSGLAPLLTRDKCAPTKAQAALERAIKRWLRRELVLERALLLLLPVLAQRGPARSAQPPSLHAVPWCASVGIISLRGDQLQWLLQHGTAAGGALTARGSGTFSCAGSAPWCPPLSAAEGGQVAQGLTPQWMWQVLHVACSHCARTHARASRGCSRRMRGGGLAPRVNQHIRTAQAPGSKQTSTPFGQAVQQRVLPAVTFHEASRSAWASVDVGTCSVAKPSPRSHAQAHNQRAHPTMRRHVLVLVLVRAPEARRLRHHRLLHSHCPTAALPLEAPGQAHVRCHVARQQPRLLLGLETLHPGWAAGRRAA